jgi:lipopolysaccharide transport protein LptA
LTVFVIIILILRSGEPDAIRDISGDDLSSFWEEMEDWHNIDYHEDGVLEREIHANRVIAGSGDPNVLEMEDVYVQTQDMKVRALKGKFLRRQNTLVLNDSVEITLGNVLRGKVYLQAEHVSVHHGPGHDFYFRASGIPVSFIHNKAKSTGESSELLSTNPLASGKAQKIEYDEGTGFLTLIGEAELQDDDLYYTGERLRYLIDQQDE